VKRQGFISSDTTASMTDLGDFFASKKKKKIRAVNLNPQKEDEAEKAKRKEREEKKDGEWDETETSEQPAPKAELGNMAKEEEEEEAPKPAKVWSVAKASAPAVPPRFAGANAAKAYPSLQAATCGMPIGSVIGKDGTDPFAAKSSAVKKNVFGSLAEPDSDDEKKGGQGITSKKRGERDVKTDTVEVPLDKETMERKASQAKKKEEKSERRNEIKSAKKAEEVIDETIEASGVPEDCLIPMDAEAARKKYEGRRKLPFVILPQSELNETVAVQSQRKKFKVIKVVEEEKKLLTLDENDAWA